MKLLKIFLLACIVMVTSIYGAEGSQSNILWHNSTTGAVKFMPINNMIPEDTLNVVDSSNLNLLPRGIGDFTGDNEPDILFHNQNSGNLRIWEMDGAVKVDNILVLGSSNTNLMIAGVGDFDQDGDNDIATFNTNSGALRMWVMEGTVRVDNVLVLTGANTNLVPRGAGDMDGDGVPDLVLRNNNSGAVRIWTMNSNFTRKGNEYIRSSSNTNLELRGVVDINDDGNNDILNYNTSTGVLRAWLMDGNLSITENAEIVQESNLDWSVRGGSETVAISVEPASAIVAPGQAKEFFATITGLSNQAVTWSASVGEIIEEDRFIAYIAPDFVGVYTVTATSVADDSKSVTVSVTVTDKGVVLAGEPDVLAKDAVTDLNIKLESHEDDISIDDTLPYGGKVLRTDIFVEFSDTATVDEVNTLLTEINGTIIHMIEVLPIMIIRIPDPVTVDALNQIIADVETKPFVESAKKSVIAEPNNLPADLSDLKRIDHNLAVRAHAAWNVKSAIPGIENRPRLLIADFFGNGKPNDDFNTETVDYDFTSGKPGDHGYHVLGIIAGLYGKNGDDLTRGDVTGIFPERLKVRAEDLKYVHNRSWESIVLNLYDRIRTIKDIKRDAHIVINTSLGGRNHHNDYAIWWTKLIRYLGVEGQVISVTSAGNTKYDESGQPIRWHARDNSVFAYAALGTMTETNGTVIPNLTNTVVVENRVNTAATATSRPKPGCVSDRSIMGGNLSAIGTDVWSFTATGADSFSGTSMATPQVAGLAAYVWSLNPDLNASEVVDLLQETARSAETNTTGFTCNLATTHQDVIDAYDAVLAAGGDKARLALLDHGGMNPLEPDGLEPDGKFDELDLEGFLSSYEIADPTLQYYNSRSDLNGDAFLGGDSRDRFDLDDGGSPRFGNVTQNIEGIDVTYKESALTDMDILCYYAYSSFYTGDTVRRTELLGDACDELVYPLYYEGTWNNSYGDTGPMRFSAYASGSVSLGYKKEGYTFWNNVYGTHENGSFTIEFNPSFGVEGTFNKYSVTGSGSNENGSMNFSGTKVDNWAF